MIKFIYFRIDFKDDGRKMSKQNPEILYKYRACNSLVLNMLQNNQVYFSSPLDFNDPFDCSAQEFMHAKFREDMARVEASLNLGVPIASLANNQIQNFRERINQDARLIQTERDIQSATEELRNQLGILSLSARNDSILMWSHYADMHRGFCIGYSVNNFGLPPNGIRDVIYTRDRNLGFAFALIANPNVTEDMFEEEFWRVHVLTKWIDWQYEEEWRIIGHARSASPYPDSALDRIIFGMRMSTEDRDRVRNVLAGKDVDYFEAVRSEEDFAVEIRQIEM